MSISIEKAAAILHAAAAWRMPRAVAAGGATGMSDRSSGEPDIDAVFRNGSITVVGVIAGFSLTFLTAWAANPLPWQLHDLFGIVPLAVGIVFQLISLSALLHPSSLQRARYDRAIRLFLTGLVLASLGVVAALAADAIALAERT
jgi:hypothetical protein